MDKLAILVLAFGLTLTGCKKAANLSKYKDRAAALAAKYSPKLAELSKKLPDLAKHAKDLPVGVPGADKLGKLLDENKSTLESAQKLLADLPSKIGSESPEQAQKDIDAAEKALAGDVEVAERDENEEAAIEATAAAAAPGAGSAAGSAAVAAGSAAK